MGYNQIEVTSTVNVIEGVMLDAMAFSILADRLSEPFGMSSPD